MGSSIPIPNVIEGDWGRLRIIVDKLRRLRLGGGSVPEFAGLELTDLTASRLVWSDAGKVLASKDLIDLVAGTANQVVVTDDAAGGLVLSTPQNIHVDATPEFAGITIKDSSDDIIFYVDDDEMYFTGGAVAIEAGMIMGPWLFWGTYAAP